MARMIYAWVFPFTMRRGNGLRNMQLRAEQLGGRLCVDAAARRGVRLELTLPLK